MSNGHSLCPECGTALEGDETDVFFCPSCNAYIIPDEDEGSGETAALK